MHTGTSVYVKKIICAYKMQRSSHRACFGRGWVWGWGGDSTICHQHARRTFKAFLAILFQMHLLCGVQLLLLFFFFFLFYLALTCFKGAALRNLGHLERFSEVTPLFLGRGERQVNHLLTPRSYYWHKAPALLNFLFGAS